MDYEEIVMKLIGKVSPVGETNEDNRRFENLKELCELTEQLVETIDYVSTEFNHSHEFSVKRASEYASNFLSERLKITEFR